MADAATVICPFCLPAAGQVAFAGPLIKAIWDAFPVTEGHLLLTPHRHVAIWSELHASEQAALIGAIETAQALLNERHAPDGFNVGFNQGVAAGQTIDHFHIHVIPRRAGDVADPRGGVRHVIPARGNYLAGAEQQERWRTYRPAGEPLILPRLWRGPLLLPMGEGIGASRPRADRWGRGCLDPPPDPAHRRG